MAIADGAGGGGGGGGGGGEDRRGGEKGRVRTCRQIGVPGFLFNLRHIHRRFDPSTQCPPVSSPPSSSLSAFSDVCRVAYARALRAGPATSLTPARDAPWASTREGRLATISRALRSDPVPPTEGRHCP